MEGVRVPEALMAALYQQEGAQIWRDTSGVDVTRGPITIPGHAGRSERVMIRRTKEGVLQFHMDMFQPDQEIVVQSTDDMYGEDLYTYDVSEYSVSGVEYGPFIPIAKIGKSKSRFVDPLDPAITLSARRVIEDDGIGRLAGTRVRNTVTGVPRTVSALMFTQDTASSLPALLFPGIYMAAGDTFSFEAFMLENVAVLRTIDYDADIEPRRDTGLVEDGDGFVSFPIRAGFDARVRFDEPGTALVQINPVPIGPESALYTGVMDPVFGPDDERVLLQPLASKTRTGLQYNGTPLLPLGIVRRLYAVYNVLISALNPSDTKGLIYGGYVALARLESGEWVTQTRKAVNSDPVLRWHWWSISHPSLTGQSALRIQERLEELLGKGIWALSRSEALEFQRLAAQVVALEKMFSAGESDPIRGSVVPE